MSSRKKKAVVANDTVTFKKSELIAKLKKFLETENACDGDWLNKVRIEFLGQKTSTVEVEVSFKGTYSIDIASDGVPSKEEATEAIRQEQNNGDFDGFDWDEAEFQVEKVTVVKA